MSKSTPVDCRNCIHLNSELQRAKAEIDKYRALNEWQEESIRFSAAKFVEAKRSLTHALRVLGIQDENNLNLTSEEVVERSFELLSF